MHNKPLLIAWLTVTFILSWACLCSAQDGLVHIKADQVEYNYEGQIVAATDNVVITYKDLIIYSLRAFISIDDNQLEADGSIEIHRGDETYYGDHLTYDLKTEHGYLEPLNLEITDEEISGTVFGNGKQAEIQGANSKIFKGTMTTCDLDHPHYHLSAKEIDYYPDDRIIFYHAFYYEGKVPIMYWPYLCISLKDEDNNFTTPVVGHDERMGWFLTLGYRYYINENWKGIAYFDWMSLLGRRYRFQQDFELGGRDSLKTEIAWLDNKITDNNELSTTLKYDKYFAKDWQLSLDYKWTQETEYDTFYGYTDYNKGLSNNFLIRGELKRESGNPYLRLNYFDTVNERYYSISPTVTWQPFKGGFLDLSGNWSSVTHKTSDRDSDLDTYGLTMKYNQTLSEYLKLSLYHQFNSNGRNVTDTITYTGPNWDLGWFSQTQFTSDFSYKSDQYYQSDYSMDGFKWGLTLNSTSLPIYENKDSGFRITTGWFLKERLYWTDFDKADSDGYEFSDQLAANASIKAEKDLTEHFKADIGLGWTETTSYYEQYLQYPGLYENFYPGLGTTYSLRYNNPDLKLDADFNGGYNIQSGLWEQQNITASWVPNDIGSFRFNLSYTPDPEYLTSSLAVTYKPNNDTYFGVDYAYTSSTWNSGIGSLNLQADIVRPIGDSWTVELHSRYNYFDRYINYARVTVTYDWHCRKIIFGYDATREQYVLQMVIKAFPSNPIGLSNQEDFFWNWYNEVAQ